jgi:CRP/FNR family transcriptional regulator, cyclic AMP receptor protein
MTSSVRELLRRVVLFKSLTDEMLEGLATHLRRRTFRRDTILFHKDQAGDALYIVEAGRTRIFAPAEGGDELTVDVHGPGDVFGEMALLDGLPRSASAVTLEDSVLYTLGRDEFQMHLAAHPQLASALLELLSTRLRHVMEYAETLAFLDVYGRVAHALLTMAERYGVQDDGLLINVDLTQTELASMVAATRERINRALAAFRAQGLIELRGKKYVILDPKRLRERIY